MTTFPFGYARPPGGGPQGMGTMLTWDQMMKQKTVYYLHPEVRRRFKAMIEFAASQGVPLGCGTGWRVQPNPPPPGFAKPGNSWHESCPVSPQSASALAIDTVPNISWDWMERNSRDYGLRTFRYVNNEPWHVQPTEIPGSRKYATKLPPLNVWNLPGPGPKPPKPLPPGPSVMAVEFIAGSEGDDDMAYACEGIWTYNGPDAINGAYYAVYSGGYKIWITDTATYEAKKALLAINGVDGTLRGQPDPAMFKAFGPIAGPVPADGTDAYGLPPR